jgi:hypothetical protein
MATVALTTAPPPLVQSAVNSMQQKGGWRRIESEIITE